MEINQIQLKLSNLFVNMDKFESFCLNISPKYIWLINILELEIKNKNFDAFLKTILKNFESLIDLKLFSYSLDEKNIILDALKDKLKFDNVFLKLSTDINKKSFLIYSENFEGFKSNLNEIKNFEEIKNYSFVKKEVGSNFIRHCRISEYRIIDNETYISFGEIGIWFKINNEIIDDLLSEKEIIIKNSKNKLFALKVDFDWKENNFQELKN